MAMEIRARLAAWDFGMSLMWAWSGALTRLLVHGFGDGTVAGEVVKVSLYVGSLFLSAWVGRVTGGGCGNPLTLLVRSVSDDFNDLSFTVLARIPAQVCGSIVGAALVTLILPEFTYSDPLKVGIAQGALTEGFLAFGIASVSLALTRYDPNDFIVKTWIHSMSRLTLRILGSDLTGGIMNPASAAGWAFVLGNQTARQHLLVYWIAPIQATILAAWAFRWLIQNGRKQEKRPQFMVSVPIPRRLDSSSRILSRRTHKFQ
ncbi:probable aquaporin SIP2-1 isoform X1 [Nymphaea colorata]|nr:probable aquaporin SIP2-1 isoform X1 [Nymphaea colorata]